MVITRCALSWTERRLLGVSDLLIGLLAAALATNQTAAVSNLVQQKTGIAVTLPDRNDPVEQEYQKILEMDDTSQEEVDEWLKKQATEAANGVPAVSMEARIRQRFEPVQKAYEDFLKRHPNHARARLAYGSFLNDIKEEDAAVAQWEKSLELDPKNPAAWNNLANHYGHNGSVTKAFEYYTKAIELQPKEALYYQNFGDTVYLFRRDATNYFKISEQEVFDKAMALYRKAQELDPTNFLIATELAQSYYGMKPARTGTEEGDRKAAQKYYQESLDAWKKAFALARDDIERQGVLIHFARIQINAGMYDEARKNLNSVTNEMFTATRKTLTRKLESKTLKPGISTNAPAGLPNPTVEPAGRTAEKVQPPQRP